MTARLTSEIFQQYRRGFIDEFNLTVVATNVQAIARDGVVPSVLIKAKTMLKGR